MCIRDRYKYNHNIPKSINSEPIKVKKKNKKDACIFLFLEPHINIIKNIGIKTCLLYTSDAADERSSVDLGGRRIIKKKKR